MIAKNPVRLASLVGLLACLALPLTASASSLRCGSKIIKLGMSSAEVLSFCGEPDQREVEEQDVRSGNRVIGTTQVNIWTYNQAGSRKVLEFDQDRLVKFR